MGRLTSDDSSIESDDRGQALLVDALTGLLLLVGAATVVIFATGISPLAIAQPQADAFEQDASKEVQAALSASDQDGSLKETVLSWDDENERFSDGETQAINDGAYFDHPDTRFGDRLSKIEDVYGVSINVQLVPGSNTSTPTEDTVDPIELIVATSGGGDRVVERKTITIYEGDRLQSEASTHSKRSPSVDPSDGDGDFVEDADTYPVPEGESPHGEGELYNTVTVQVVIYDV